MTEIRGREPFNTMIGAAVNDAIEHEDLLRSIHAEQPDEWVAVRMHHYWDGAVTIALFKPATLDVNEVTIRAGVDIAQTHPGPGILPVLLPADHHEIEIITGQERVLIPIREM